MTLAALIAALCLCLAALPAGAGAKKFSPGSHFKDCGSCPEMVVLPPGSFLMGSPADENRRNANEGPQHRVTISYHFAVGRFEVTQAQWQAVMGSNPSQFKGPADPVGQVAWEQADIYIRKLGQMTGQPYRLLSEAEWEYAARAGSTTAFHFGGKISTDQANYNAKYTYNGSARGQKRDTTVKVGSFPASRFGLHDMHGNIWEIVADCWNESYAGAPNDGSAWRRGGCDRRVLRGGSWEYPPWHARSAQRLYLEARTRGSHGLRVARSLAK